MTDKELAVQLAGEYLKGYYSPGNKPALDPETAKNVLQMCYDAVKSLSDE